MAMSARHRLCEAIHTAFGKPGLMGQLPNALPAVLEKKLEKPMAFIPKSHLGQSSEGGLTFVQHSTVLDYVTDNKLSRLMSRSSSFFVLTVSERREHKQNQ